MNQYNYIHLSHLDLVDQGSRPKLARVTDTTVSAANPSIDLEQVQDEVSKIFRDCYIARSKKYDFSVNP